MKKNRIKNSEECNSSEDSETDYRRQYAKHFEDTRSLNNDCSQKVQYNLDEKSNKLCGYCRKSEHSVNDCPLFMEAIEQQKSMICAYNKISSSNHSKQLEHFTCYNETDQQHLELLQKAQEEYYTKHCKYCKEYGHLEYECPVLGKAAHRQPEDDWIGTEKRKSKKSKKNKVLESEVYDLSEIDHSASGNTKETKENDLSKYCHYCKEYGHIENICPLVQKALKKQKEKPFTILPKIHKKINFLSKTPKVKDSRKFEICNFCGNSDHKEDDCAEKNQYEYFKKRGRYYNEQVQLKDMCPSLEEDVKKFENQNHKFYLNGQSVTNDLNSKIKFKHVKTLNECSFCGNSDHSESECEEKLQNEYISKCCHYCEEYGHFEDTCPLVEQAAKEMEKESYCEVVPKSSKRVTFANDVTTLTENLAHLKICHICDEFGHNENDCFVRQQAEFYSKYCDHCKENGHNESDCVLSKQSYHNCTVTNNFSKKGLEFKTRAEYASICSDHYLCENCHSVYFHEHNNSKSEKCSPKNARNSTVKSSFEENACRLRYCTLCGIEGLIDTCILKGRVTE